MLDSLEIISRVIFCLGRGGIPHELLAGAGDGIVPPAGLRWIGTRGLGLDTGQC